MLPTSAAIDTTLAIPRTINCKGSEKDTTVDEQRQTIAKNIHARRLQLGLTQAEVGMAVGLPTADSAKGWVRRREYGTAGLHLEDLHPLCDALSIAEPLDLLRPDAFDLPDQGRGII
jgi:transcriptional regulator with XRE-family HTH domain